MGNYVFRVVNAALGSELVPAGLRTRLMRAVGFDLNANTCIWARGNFRSHLVHTAPNVFINVGFYHDGHELVDIGRDVRIGPYVRVITATHAIGPPHQRGRDDVVAKGVRIGDACWICAGVTLLPGVTIARGCVVGANAVVHHSTEPDGLYVGNPARRVRDLDTVDQALCVT